MKTKHSLSVIIVLALSLVQFACSKTATTSSSTSITKINRPITLKLTKSYNNNSRTASILIKLKKIGNQTVDSLLLFDTGSAGISINIDQILPGKMYNTNGIIMTGNTLVYNGIRFTNKEQTVSYGGAGSTTTQYGVTATAKITIGDDSTSITSDSIQLFVYYRIEKNGVIVADGINHGIFGANTVVQPQKAPIFSHFSYGAGIGAGFILQPLGNTWTACNFDQGTCPVSPLLTIGLTNENTSGYTIIPLQKQTGTSGFIAAMPSVFIDKNGSQNAMTLLDTGTGGFGSIALSLDASNPITFQAGGKFSWNFTAPAAAILGNTSTTRSILGIGFFQNNSMFIDFDRGNAGLK